MISRDKRVALIRVFKDLILADTIIDAGEMRYYALLRKELGLKPEDEVEAQSLTFAAAIGYLRDSAEDVRLEIVDRCNRLSGSNGFHARSEALIVTSVLSALDDTFCGRDTIISVPKSMMSIPASCAIYIESGFDPDVNRSITDNLRNLTNDLRVAGLNLIYIPEIVKQFSTLAPDNTRTESQLLSDVVAFLTPERSAEGRASVCASLMSMTSAEFTHDILCNKLGMIQLRETGPALLIKIGSSYVGDEVYSNYLKINLEGDIITLIRNFTDKFISLMSADTITIDNVAPDHSRILYDGFYKLLLDAHLLRRNVRSRILLNPADKDIFFSDIDVHLNTNVYVREKAFYMLVLAASKSGGINFERPERRAELEAYKQRIKRIQKEYDDIYFNLFMGSGKSVDLSDHRQRSPMLSRINKAIGALSERLFGIDDYLISRDEKGNYATHIDPGLVSVHVCRNPQNNPPKKLTPIEGLSV